MTEVTQTGAGTEIARSEMPQIPKEKLPEFVQWLRLNDAKVVIGKTPANSLTPVQHNVNQEKVEAFRQNLSAIKKDWLVVSKEGYILDGHHRWIALSQEDAKTPVRIIRAELPIKELIQLGHEFKDSYSAGIAEMKLVSLIPEWIRKQVTPRKEL